MSAYQRFIKAYQNTFPCYSPSGSQFSALKACFHRELELKGLTGISISPRPILHRVSHVCGEPIIVMKSLVDEEDICRLRRLSQSVKLHYPLQNISREFKLSPVSYFGDEALDDSMGDEGANISSYGGGNNAIFVGGFIQTLMPNLLAYILRSVSDATAGAGWYPHMAHLGIRCAESLVYHSGGQLMLHKDTESVFTIVVMLSDPCSSDFTGGEFVIQSQQQHVPCGGDNSNAVSNFNSDIIKEHSSNGNNSVDSGDCGRTLLRVAMKQGDAIVFDSNSLHGVEPILSGERHVLVLEMWPYVDSKRGDHRPAASLYADRFRIPTLIQR